MKKFKVWANSMEHYVAYVDAPDEDEAYKMEDALYEKYRKTQI